MRNRYQQRALEQARAEKQRELEEMEMLERFRMEASLAESRRRVAGRLAADAPPAEPEAPEVPMETETTKEVSQDAGMDGSGAKHEVTTTTSRPHQVQRTPEQEAPQQAEPRGAGDETRQTNPEWVKGVGEATGDYAKAVPQGVLTALEETEDFIASGARDFWGLAERDAVQLDRPEERVKSVFTQAKRAVAFADPEATGPKLVASFAQILVPYIGVANRL